MLVDIHHSPSTTMVLTEAEKKESHRAACARYYQKWEVSISSWYIFLCCYYHWRKKRPLREKSKLHMRRLRASRKLGADPQESINKNLDVFMEVPSSSMRSQISPEPPTVRPTKQQPRKLSNKRNTPRVPPLKRRHSPSPESELPNSSCESNSEEQSESPSEDNSERGQERVLVSTFDGLPLAEYRWALLRCVYN